MTGGMMPLAWLWAALLAVGLPLGVAGRVWPGRNPTRHAGTPTGTGARRAELDLREAGELTETTSRGVAWTAVLRGGEHHA